VSPAEQLLAGIRRIIEDCDARASESPQGAGVHKRAGYERIRALLKASAAKETT